MLFVFKIKILTFSILTLSIVTKNTEAVRDRGARCEKPDYIPNGSYRMRRDRLLRITCNTGYQLQGSKTIDCVRGKWEGEKPVCAKKGCLRELEQPENGRIQIENDVKAILYCSDNYNLAGNRYSYCNGTHWDRPIGNCRARKNVVQHKCDFETDDICGWTYEPREGLEWKRVMAANVFTTFKTGPRHDHTTLTANGGHYMLMESLTRHNDDVILTSPIYERALSLRTACCFQFYYFMYGAGVGDLFVIVKPVTWSLNNLIRNRKELIKFQKYGNQNNIWNEAHFNIEELEEDFQILFVAKSGRGQLSDIAIDDVKLLTGDECRSLDTKEYEEMSNEEYDSTTYESLYEIQSCVGRCYDSTGNGIIRISDHLKGLCNCDIDCENNETCCPDFRTACLGELFAQSTVTSMFGETTEENEEQINNIITIETTTTTSKTTPNTSTSISTTPTTVKTTPSTVRTTSTTMRTTPTTTTIKTTTTPKPNTANTTTTTTTTRKITTTTTRRSSLKTTPRKSTPTTTKTTTIKAIASTTSKTTDIGKNSTATSTRKLIPSLKPIEYIMKNTSKPEAAHKGSGLLICTFVLIAIIILAGTVYRHFGEKAVTWYMIRFKRNNSNDEYSSSITTSFKRPQENHSDMEQNSKISGTNRMKKSRSIRNTMKTPLVSEDDEDDDADIGPNGNIALKTNIYTEL